MNAGYLSLEFRENCAVNETESSTLEDWIATEKNCHPCHVDSARCVWVGEPQNRWLNQEECDELEKDIGI